MIIFALYCRDQSSVNFTALLKYRQNICTPVRKGIFLAAFVLLFSVVSGEIPPGYYNQAAGNTGEALQVALYNIIKGHTVKNYDYLWLAFYTTDVTRYDTVWDMYSDVPGGTPPYIYHLGSNQCGSGGGGIEGDCYSREHSFPKSWFNDLSPMYTDLFHIYPVDQYVNNRRSNYPYGTVSSPTWTSLNGGKVGPCSTSGYSGTVFEPIDAYKGDFARTYFYMATRYENLIATWPYNDPNAAAVLDSTSYPAFRTWFLNMLIQWHNQDPVSAKEIARNDAVYDIQHNRNPFIDHPEYVSAIWEPSGPQPEPANHVTGFTATTGILPYSSIRLTWTDATGPVIPSGYLIRGSVIGFSDIVSPVDGSPVPDGALNKNTGSGLQTCTFSGLSSNTIYYFKIFPFTNAGSAIDYKIGEPVPAAYDTTTNGVNILQAGDIAIVEYGSVNPDKLSFITFKQLSAGTVINFTDKGYASPTTVGTTSEGLLSYTAPTVIPPGTVISWQNGMDISGTGWDSNNPGNFAFNASGDQLFVYQGTWGTDQTLLCGLNAGNAGWITSGSITAQTSYFPSVLTNEVNSLMFPESNGNYNLVTSGSVNALGSLIANPLNWTKSTSIIPTPSWNFNINSNTGINQNATVFNFTIDPGETVTVQPGVTLSVTGNMTIK